MSSLRTTQGALAHAWIAGKIGATAEEVRKAMQLIRTLNPKPGSVELFRRLLRPDTPILNWGCPGRGGEPVAD